MQKAWENVFKYVLKADKYFARQRALTIISMWNSNIFGFTRSTNVIPVLARVTFSYILRSYRRFKEQAHLPYFD